MDYPEYESVAEDLKKKLHEQLAALGDADPIKTEKSQVKGGKRKKKKD